MNLFTLSPILLRRAEDLDAEALYRRGVRLLLMDLDNTLAPYHIDKADESVRRWIGRLRAAGIEPFILSNNRGDRPALFAGQLETGYVGRARKPSVKALRRVLAEKGLSPHQAALIGDQVYTDALCAARAGLTAVLVRPISLKNPLLALRYGLEAPFRFLYKVR